MTTAAALPAKSITTANQSMQYLVHIYNFETALHAQREPRQSVSKANQGRLGESWKKFFLHALHSMLYPHVNKAATGAELKTLLKPRPSAFLQSYHCTSLQPKLWFSVYLSTNHNLDLSSRICTVITALISWKRSLSSVFLIYCCMIFQRCNHKKTDVLIFRACVFFSFFPLLCLLSGATRQSGNG